MGGRTRVNPSSAASGGGDHAALAVVSLGPLRRSDWDARAAKSKIHLQDVEAADVAIDGVDDLALVDEDVVELNGAGGRHWRRRRHEHADLLRLVGIGNIVGAQSAVEEGAEHDLIGLPGS